MPTREQITDTTPAVDVVAAAITASTGLPVGRLVARDTLDALVGDDDTPGPLDRYNLIAQILPATGKPLIMWHCPRDCVGAGDGYVGIIVRDMDGDQSDLTLGEIVEAVLRHERENHEDAN